MSLFLFCYSVYSTDHDVHGRSRGKNETNLQPSNYFSRLKLDQYRTAIWEVVANVTNNF